MDPPFSQRSDHPVQPTFCVMAEMLALQQHVESRFDHVAALGWMGRYWYFSVIFSATYVLLLLLGTRWMRERKPYNLRRSLVMWNAGLAVFSVLGLWKVEVPALAKKMIVEGIEEVSCRTTTYDTSHLCLWVFLFGLSKVIELGDTAFIVLRKTPLNFLHWYHHITVLIYAWYTLSYKPAPAILFCSMNYVVHTVMYSYYAVKAGGYRVPSQVAMVITILQILQMIAGIAFNITGFIALQRGDDCQFSYRIFIFGITIYTSYLILFGNFFYQRYIGKKVKSV